MISRIKSTVSVYNTSEGVFLWFIISLNGNLHKHVYFSRISTGLESLKSSYKWNFFLPLIRKSFADKHIQGTRRTLTVETQKWSASYLHENKSECSSKTAKLDLLLHWAHGWDLRCKIEYWTSCPQTSRPTTRCAETSWRTALNFSAQRAWRKLVSQVSRISTCQSHRLVSIRCTIWALEHSSQLSPISLPVNSKRRKMSSKKDIKANHAFLFNANV